MEGGAQRGTQGQVAGRQFGAEKAQARPGGPCHGPHALDEYHVPHLPNLSQRRYIA